MTRRQFFPLALCVLIVSGLGCAPSPVEETARVRALQAQGRYAETLDTLVGLLAEQPGDPQLNHFYGVALFRTGSVGMAVWPLSRASEATEHAVEDGLLLAQALMLSVLPNRNSLAVLDRVLEIEPEHEGALTLRAGVHMRLEQYEEVLDDTEQLLAEQPANGQMLLWRMKSLAELERFDEAEAAIAKSQEPTTGRSRADNWGAPLCAVAAEIKQARGDDDAAAEQWQACLEEYPARPELVAESLRFFDERGEPESSEAVLRASIAAAPGTLSFRSDLARRLDAAGDRTQAVELLREAAEAAVPGAWLALAGLHRAHADFADAKHAMEKVLQNAQAVPPLYLAQYGDDLVNMGEFAAADLVIERIEEPRLAELLAGRSLLAQGDPAAALEHLEAGLLLWPGNPTGRWLAARAAEQLGDFDRAIAEYRNSVRADPGHTEAALRVAQIYEAEGSYGDALLMLGYRMKALPNDPEVYLRTIRIAIKARRRGAVSDSLAKLASLPGQESTALVEAAAIDARRAGPRAAAERITRSDLDLRSPEHAEVLRALVEHLALAGGGNEALGYTQAAITEHPESAALQEIHAHALEATARPLAEIRDALDRSLSIESTRPSARSFRARLTAKEGRIEDALALYDELAESEESDVASAWAAIELLEPAGRNSEAVARLTALLEHEPIHTAAANRLAQHYLIDGELARAEALAKRAVRFGGGAAALETRGRVALARQDVDAALRDLRRALELAPEAESARQLLGRLESEDRDG